MTYNLYKQLRGLLIDDRLQVGVVTAVEGGDVSIELPDGAKQVVRGSATVGSTVYIRGGAIEGPAPSLPVVEITI